MSVEKKARAEGDEWAKMFQYNIQVCNAWFAAKALGKKRQGLRSVGNGKPPLGLASRMEVMNAENGWASWHAPPP